MALTATLYGGSESIALASSLVADVADFGDGVISLPLMIRDTSADNVQTKLRTIQRILNRANVQQDLGLGYPRSFVQELDCYLDFLATGVTTQGRYRIIKGKLALGGAFLDIRWRGYVARCTLILQVTSLLAATWTQGTKNAAAWSAMPITIASGDTGGNNSQDVSPIRLAIRNPAATTYGSIYGAIYPNLGTPIKSNDGVGTGCLVDTVGAGVDATLYDGKYYRTNIDSTSYEQVGSLAITTDGRPRRYLVIIKRRTSVVTNLNWRITTSAGVVVSPVWADDSTPNNTFGAFVAGQFSYPHFEFTGTTDASGDSTTFNVTLQLQAAKQAAGDTTADVDTDFVIFIPQDLGTYFLAQPSSAVFVAADHDNLHIYNEDGIARLALAKGAGGKGGPGELVDSVSPTAVTFSGNLPSLYPGGNQVIAVGIRSDDTIMHSDTFSLVWTIRKRLDS